MSELNPGAPGSFETTLGGRELLEIIAQKCPGSTPYQDGILYGCGLVVSADPVKMQKNGDTWTARVLFFLRHNWFDETMVLPVTCTGTTPDAAMKAAAEQFADVYLPSLLDSFMNESAYRMDAELPETHSFRVPADRRTYHTGAGEPADLWNEIADLMPRYLGTKRAYWIELRTRSGGGTARAEVRVNGMVCHRPGDILLGKMMRQADAPFRSDRQFVLLLQHAQTLAECPYDKQKVGDLTFRAMRIFQNIQDQDSRDAMTEAVQSLTSVPALGEELVTLIPEIVAEMTAGLPANDGLIAMKPDGSRIRLNRSQLRSYGYIEDAVFQYLQKQKPSQEDIFQLLSMSARFRAVNEAVQKQIPVEEFRMSELVYRVGEDYRIF